MASSEYDLDERGRPRGRDGTGGCEHHNVEVVFAGVGVVAVGIECDDCKATAWLPVPLASAGSVLAAASSATGGPSR